MSNSLGNGLEPTAGFCKQAEGSSPPIQGLFGELCKFENLELAYAQVRTDFQSLGIDALTLETVEGEGVEKFLRQLSNDLRARTYRTGGSSPAQPARSVLERGEVVALRDQVVRAALKLLLDSVFPPALPCDPEPEKAIAWIARVIEQGPSRVYAVHLEECPDAGQQERLWERASWRIGDPEIIGLLKEILTTSAQQGTSQRGPLVAPLLANIAYAGIDRMLRQAKAIGREGGVVHVTCARFADGLVILSDHDPRYDWVLPAVRQRLREELAELRYDTNPTQTQFVDLARGDKFRFLGFELRSVTSRDGSARVQYKRVDTPVRRERKPLLRPHLGRHFLGTLTACVSLLRRVPSMLSVVSKRRLWTATGLLGAAVCAALVLTAFWRQSAKPETGFIDCVYTDPDGEEYKYVLYVPPTYSRHEPSPLLVFLHGTHEKGTDGRAQLKVGLAQAIWRSLKVPGVPPFKFLALFPQSRTGGWMADSPDGELVMQEITDAEKKYAIDPARIYLTGHSSGGKGTWDLANKYPNRWAAIVPVCGSYDPASAPRICHIPCWCFHGDADQSIPVAVPRRMVKALKDAGGQPRYTELPGLYHNVWRNVYVMPELYEWLARQRLNQPPA